MHTNIIAVAIVAMIGVVGPASAEEERSAAWFADHPKERSEVSEICKNSASQVKRNPNCDNAFQGGLIASARERDRDAGISNLPAPSIEYWRDPKNAENRAFWARQCKIAEAKGRPPEVLEGMWCPGIKASGGY
jgi:hypothetical protein